MKLFIKYIVSTIVVLMGWSAVGFGQDSLQVAPSTSLVKKDSGTIANASKSVTVLLGVDYGKLVTNVLHIGTKYEGTLSIRFNKHLGVLADIGYGDLSPDNAIQNGDYHSKGMYYRVGADYSFEIAPKTFLNIGAMYAFTTFNDEGTVRIESEVWPSLSQSFERTNLHANWSEVVVTSLAPIMANSSTIWKHFYWGLKLRLRFLIDYPQPEIFDVYAIPGYGATHNRAVPAANIIIGFAF